MRTDQPPFSPAQFVAAINTTMKSRDFRLLLVKPEDIKYLLEQIDETKAAMMPFIEEFPLEAKALAQLIGSMKGG